MPLVQYPWRQFLQPASFRGAEFHVEEDARASGRRVALHEYPKRNDPYAEDMGRRARRHVVEGYIIMSPRDPNYLVARDALIEALETDGPGVLQHPLLGRMSVMCDAYSVHESRTRGGFCVFSMTFIEEGRVPDLNAGGVDTRVQVGQRADELESAASSQLSETLQTIERSTPFASPQRFR